MDIGAIGQIPNVAYGLTPYPGGPGLNAVSEEAAKAQAEHSQKVAKTQRRLLAAAFASNLPLETAGAFVDAVKTIESFLAED